DHTQSVAQACVRSAVSAAHPSSRSLLTRPPASSIPDHSRGGRADDSPPRTVIPMHDLPVHTDLPIHTVAIVIAPAAARCLALGTHAQHRARGRTHSGAPPHRPAPPVPTPAPHGATLTNRTS